MLKFFIKTSACFVGAIVPLLITTEVFATTNSLTVTTSGPQVIDVKPNKDGTTGTAISEDEINVITTCRAGYNFAISTSNDDNNLYLNGDDSDNGSGTYFSPADGTSTLSNSPDTWGYYYDESTTPGNSSVFSPVPILGSADTLITPQSSASETDINDTFSIYYGVAVSPTMRSGIYKMKLDDDTEAKSGSIVYYATMADSCVTYTVEFSPTSTSSGESISGTGTMSSQTIHEGIAVNLNSNTFTAPSGYEFGGWNTAQDGTGTFYPDGASVTDLTSSGTSITLYAVWNKICSTRKICYNDNGANSVTKMGDQSISTSATEAILWASNFQREDYGFAGWSDTPDYELNGTNTGHVIYGPNETIDDSTIIDGIKNTAGLKLYAIWVPVAKDDNGDELTFQTANLLTTTLEDGTTLNSKSNGYITALRDSRDDDVYAIAKLDDGKYWMIENLRLDTADSLDATKSSTGTYGGDFSGLADPETANFDDVTPIPANSRYISDGTGSIYDETTSPVTLTDIGTTNYPAYRIPRYRNDNTNSDSSINPNTTVDNMTAVGQRVYSYGNYYSWAAAIADTTYRATKNSSIFTSLCPTGWRLPRGGDKDNEANDEFWNLIVNELNEGIKPANYDSSTTPYYTGTEEAIPIEKKIRKYPNNFLYSGSTSTSSIYGRGTDGGYWSSTANGINAAYHLNFSSLNKKVYPASTYGKDLGQTLRCVAGI